MKIILHGVDKDEELPILALRAAWGHLENPIGQMIGVRFDNGEMFAVKRNKKSVSVWKQ